MMRWRTSYSRQHTFEIRQNVLIEVSVYVDPLNLIPGPVQFAGLCRAFHRQPLEFIMRIGYVIFYQRGLSQVTEKW